MTEDNITSPSSPPAVLIPPRDVFATRAARFEQLADNHALGDWLRFLGQISKSQHDCLRKAPPGLVTDSPALAQARAHAMPPLPAQTLPRDPMWRAILQCLCEDIAKAAPKV